MWPACINQLSPLPYPLKEEIPKFLKRALSNAGIKNEAEMFIPIRPVALLGKCSTARYLDCPNILDSHIDLAWDYREGRGNPDDYDIGQYYWFDFNIVGSNQETMLELRMVFNEGAADCDDGLWGAVWERNTEFQVADILSDGGTAIIAARSINLIDEDRFQDIEIPLSFDVANDYDPLPCQDIEFFNNLKLEEIIGVAIRWCCVFTSEWSYERHGYDL